MSSRRLSKLLLGWQLTDLVSQLKTSSAANLVQVRPCNLNLTPQTPKPKPCILHIIH